MKNYLAEIVERKIIEVSDRKKIVALETLKTRPEFSRQCFSLKKKLIDTKSAGVIAEFKRSSPSLGVINKNVNLRETVLGYQEAGAFAVSVLTDEIGFGGSLNDLEEARSLLNIPILRKEFIVDEYQIFESKAFGADLILLIAACLTPLEVETFSQIARSLGMEVLLEVHGREELGHVCETIDLLGVNNRNLQTFKVSLKASKEIAKIKLNDIPLISESGLKSNLEIKELMTYGFKGFLMGEAFMKSEKPEDQCKRIISKINSSTLLLKICGMREILADIFREKEFFPSLLGYISQPESKRYISSVEIAKLLESTPNDTGKVLVTVDLEIDTIKKYFSETNFTHIQLHGDESLTYIRELKTEFPNLKIIKAIAVKDSIDRDYLKSIESEVDLFLFDSKGLLKGGNGIKFSWSALNDYDLDLPYFLSGGIQLKDLDQILEMSKRHKKMIGIDVNSGFEISPGVKDIEKIKLLIEKLSIRG